MAVCRRCSRVYDPDEAAIDFESDEFVIEHDVGYTYESMKDLCADCALDEVYDSLPQGLEDLSYRLWDD